MKPKLKDLAEKSGYSITTVSRALAGYSDVSPKTRERILQIATQLGYEPNSLGQQLRLQETRTIGMIIPANDESFSNDFFTQLMMGVGNMASLHRYDLLISAQSTGEEEMQAYRRMVGGRRADGMILARTRRSDPRIVYLKSQQYPFAVSGRAAPDEQTDFPYIDVDSQAGIRMLVEHFVSLGHRHIGLILPPPELAFTDYRHAGYLEGLEKAGIIYRPDYVVHGNLLRSGGYYGTFQLLDENPEITAVIACNDLMALGAMSAIQGQGRRVGLDIAVAGFDDIPSAEYSHPTLTTIRQPIYEIGQRLVNMLLSLIKGHPLEDNQILLTPTLMVRDSSGGKRV